MIASVILLLHLIGLIPLEAAVNFLYLTGALLIIAEIFVTSFGVLFLNALMALFIAYSLQTGDNGVFGIPVDWPFLFGVAFIEVGVIVVTTIIYIRHKKIRPSTGTEGMIGAKATVIRWDGAKGSVRVHGEEWKAELSDKKAEPLQADDTVSVDKVDGLVLSVSAAPEE